MTTGEAAERVAKLFKELGFAGEGMADPMVTNADVFAATVPARADGGKRIDVGFEWLSQFRTRVRMTSDLDENKFRFVEDRVRGVVGWSATQP
jgi:hypothetical protein